MSECEIACAQKFNISDSCKLLTLHITILLFCGCGSDFFNVTPTFQSIRYFSFFLRKQLRRIILLRVNHFQSVGQQQNRLQSTKKQIPL